MNLFIDTANIHEIRAAWEMGVISGVTTNPSLIAKEGRDVLSTVKEIAELVDGPVSGEVGAETVTCDAMVKEGQTLAALHPNIVVKIPMTESGLRAVSILKQHGVRTNVTLIFSAMQALLAARAGASYVSPFVGRLNDISVSGVSVVRDSAAIFAQHAIETRIIAASIRTPIDVLECALAGAHIATVPYAIIRQMVQHPLTDQGIQKFKADWLAVFGAK